MVLLKTEFMTEKEIEQEVEQLNEILVLAETAENFCKVHELVKRNTITSFKSRLLKIYYRPELKPFWFLLNRN